MVPPPSTKADTSLIEAYRARGLRVDETAPDVSIIRAGALMQEAIKGGNYQLALEWCESVLQRYKSHPEFLKAKASLSLMRACLKKGVKSSRGESSIHSKPRSLTTPGSVARVVTLRNI